MWIRLESSLSAFCWGWQRKTTWAPEDCSCRGDFKIVFHWDSSRYGTLLQWRTHSGPGNTLPELWISALELLHTSSLRAALLVQPWCSWSLGELAGRRIADSFGLPTSSLSPIPNPSIPNPCCIYRSLLSKTLPPFCHPYLTNSSGNRGSRVSKYF